MRIEQASPAWAAMQSELVRRLQDMRRTATIARTADVQRSAGRPSQGQQTAWQRVQVQLAQIPADAPDAESRVFRLFLESVLVEQFGDAVVLNAAFFDMVDEIQRQMEAHPRLASKITKLANSILKPGPPRGR